jgi:hypothetical protein
MEFKNGLSSSVLTNNTVRYKNLELEIKSIQKKSKIFKRRQPHFSQTMRSLRR